MSEADLSEQGVVTLGSPDAGAFLGVAHSAEDLSEQGVVTPGSPEAGAFLGVVKSDVDLAGTGADFRGEDAEPASESLSGSTARRILAAAIAREHLGAGAP